jgi:hypothetical protein
LIHRWSNSADRRKTFFGNQRVNSETAAQNILYQFLIPEAITTPKNSQKVTSKGNTKVSPLL